MILKSPDGSIYSFHFWLAAARPDADPDTTICVGHEGTCKFRNGDGKDIQVWPCDYVHPVYVATHCSRSDDFRLGKGRVVALTRAFYFLHITRPIRTALWKDYFRKIGNPKKK